MTAAGVREADAAPRQGMISLIQGSGQGSGPSIEGIRPIDEIADIVEARYVGRIIDVEIDAGKRQERAAIVYEVRLLTEQGNVIKVRLDAVSGDFLEVDGRGLIEALRQPAVTGGRQGRGEF